MTNYQKLPTDRSYMDTSGYKPIVERVYDSNHPEVEEWTARFTYDAYCTLDFQKFHGNTPRSYAKAAAVGTQWYRFSAFMPWFLCQAAARVSSNEKRHYVIQTAFEELGMRNVAEIHSEMFRETCIDAGVGPHEFKRLDAYWPITALLGRLREQLFATNSDDEVLGLLLGLELPAEDNISSVYWSVAYDDHARGVLDQSKFFRLHMALEVEHVRLTVSNFIRFCTTDAAKERFQGGFLAGIEFWRDYWETLAVLIGGGA